MENMYSDDDVTASDPWRRTLEMLSSGVDGWHDGDRCSVVAPRDTSSAYRVSENVQIRILERPTNSTVIIHWSDPGRCFYGHQSSRVAKASIAGRCAFSRVAIREGDEVYRPAYTNVKPQNAQAMILVSAVYRTGAHADRAERKV